MLPTYQASHSNFEPTLEPDVNKVNRISIKIGTCYKFKQEQ